MRLHDHVLRARERLTAAGLRDQDAAFDAELLARHVLGWDRATYLTDRDGAPPPRFADEYDRLVARRARREPVALILGRREFWGLEFEVSTDVLIPRPATELLVEEALRRARRTVPRLIVDVGTGCGCLAVALAHELPGVPLVATDISQAALLTARRNAARHGVAERLRFVRTSYLEGLAVEADLIVSNPPYVPSVSAPGLQPEIRNYEPAVALFGGQDGLLSIRHLLAQAGRHLSPGGCLLMEFGYGQEDEVRDIVSEVGGLEVDTVLNDLDGIARAAGIRRPA